MIRINLLPHREMRRERRKKEFVAMIVGAALVGVAVALLGGFAINGRISAQAERNAFIEAENKKLDAQIKEIATLRAEIEALKARQQAVEDLQRNRTIPVHLLDELVKNTPEGIYLKSVRQDARKVSLSGYAQTNERIAELLRNLASQTPWLEKPELSEIKSVDLKSDPARRVADRGKQPPTPDRVFEFALNAMLLGPSEQEAAARGANGEKGAPAKAQRKVATN